jgi:hypothetical protein
MPFDDEFLRSLFQPCAVERSTSLRKWAHFGEMVKGHSLANEVWAGLAGGPESRLRHWFALIYPRPIVKGGVLICYDTPIPWHETLQERRSSLPRYQLVIFRSVKRVPLFETILRFSTHGEIRGRPIITDDFNCDRYHAGRAAGHRESYFQRANHPTRPPGVLGPLYDLQSGMSAARCHRRAVVFNGSTRRHIVARTEVPIERCAFSNDRFHVRIADSELAPGVLITPLVLRHPGKEYACNSLWQWFKARASRLFASAICFEEQAPNIEGEIRAPQKACMGLRYYNPPGRFKYRLNLECSSVDRLYGLAPTGRKMGHAQSTVGDASADSPTRFIGRDGANC